MDRISAGALVNWKYLFVRRQKNIRCRPYSVT